MKEIKKHATFSASGSKRWLSCPASVKLEEQAPEQDESPWAVEGTRAHDFLETWLNKLKTNSFAMPPVELIKDREMFKAVKIAAEWVLENWNREYEELLIEEKVSLDFIRDDMFGTCDIALVDEFGILKVFDYKHGAGQIVNVIEHNEASKTRLNTQLVYYALGMAAKYNFNFSMVEIGIIQPRADHKEGPIRSETLTIQELKSYIEVFSRGVKNAMKPNPSFVVGSWCYWCKARQICPKQEQMKIEKLNEFFD